jgi:hypothetical protein
MNEVAASVSVHYDHLRVPYHLSAFDIVAFDAADWFSVVTDDLCLCHHLMMSRRLFLFHLFLSHVHLFHTLFLH